MSEYKINVIEGKRPGQKLKDWVMNIPGDNLQPTTN